MSYFAIDDADKINAINAQVCRHLRGKHICDIVVIDVKYIDPNIFRTILNYNGFEVEVDFPFIGNASAYEKISSITDRIAGYPLSLITEAVQEIAHEIGCEYISDPNKRGHGAFSNDDGMYLYLDFDPVKFFFLYDKKFVKRSIYKLLYKEAIVEAGNLFADIYRDDFLTLHAQRIKMFRKLASLGDLD